MMDCRIAQVLSIYCRLIMEHIYIIDDDNKEFDHMRDLNENISNLINGNVCKMQESGRSIRVISADLTRSDEFEKRLGYKWSQCLYYRLIHEYNMLQENMLLKTWCKAY